MLVGGGGLRIGSCGDKFCNGFDPGIVSARYGRKLNPETGCFDSSIGGGRPAPLVE